MDAIQSKLLRYEFEQKYLVFDFETCSLNLCLKEVNKPYQLGWQLYKGKKLIASYEDWIKWDNLPMTAAAAAINKFNPKEYAEKATDPKEIFDRFTKYLYREDVISISANGVGFDSNILNLYAKDIGEKSNYSYLKRHICVQNSYKAHKEEFPIPRVNTYEWFAFNISVSNYVKKGLKPNLKNLCHEYEVDYDENKHHVSALYDVELTKNVFDKQIGKIDIFI